MILDDIQELLEYEASIVKDWPPELQELVDSGLVVVKYNIYDEPIFSFTNLGKEKYKTIDPNLN